MATPFSGLPAALRTLRKRRGLSQKEWADRAKISPSNLSLYELGKTDPGVNNLDKLLVAVDADIAELDEILQTQRGQPPGATALTAQAARALLGELQGHIQSNEWAVLADLARIVARERKANNRGEGET